MPHPNPEPGPAPVSPPRPAGGRRPDRVRWYVRAGLLAVGLGLAGVFGIAAYLDPYNADGSPRTMATHTQLGMPPCSFVVMTNRPCPACGMTTSFALLVRGDVGASARANWAGTVLAVGWAGVMVWALAGAWRGRPLFLPPHRLELATTVAVGLLLVLMLGRWAVVLLTG